MTIAPNLIFPAIDFREPTPRAPRSGEPIPIHRDWRVQYRKAREARAAFRDSFKLSIPLPSPNHFTVTDLTDDVCHWPVTDDAPFLFCGQASGGATYCACHAAQAFRRPLSYRERKAFRMPI